MTPDPKDDYEDDSEIYSEPEGTSEEVVYEPRNMLPEPSYKQYSADVLFSWIMDGGIDLDPPYQRDVVWPETKQIKLIDSFLRNFFVPPVVCSVQPGERGPVRICIDGKQRLTSLKRFMLGEIPHIDSITKKKYYYKLPKGGQKGAMRLPARLITQTKTMQIAMIEYKDLPSKYEREIFQRVQLGIPLQSAERMAAISGPWADLATALRNEYMIEEALPTDNLFHLDTGRGKDFLYMAHFLCMIHSWPLRASLSASSIEKFLANPTPPPPHLATHARSILETFKAVCGIKDIYGNIQRIAPVEMVSILLLIAQHMNSPHQEIAGLIIDMRTKVRKKHKDIRTNTAVLKTTYDVIEEQLNRKDEASRSTTRKRKKIQELDEESSLSSDEDFKMKVAPTSRRVVRTRMAPSNTPIQAGQSSSAIVSDTPGSQLYDTAFERLKEVQRLNQLNKDFVSNTPASTAHTVTESSAVRPREQGSPPTWNYLQQESNNSPAPGTPSRDSTMPLKASFRRR